jgi:hypothetical protein
MLNLFQHLIKSNSYETLKQVQGDILILFTQPVEADIGMTTFTKNKKGHPEISRHPFVILYFSDKDLNLSVCATSVPSSFFSHSCNSRNPETLN